MSLVRDNMVDNLKSYFDHLSVAEPLSREEEGELADRVQAGDQEAMDQLVKANMRFVVHVAVKYERYLDLPELIGAGNLGLVIAAKRFDKKKGCKFITYAVWWIRQSILETITEQSRLIRLPGNKVNMLGEMRKTSRRLGREDGADMEELAESLAEEMGLPIDEIMLVIQANKTCCSLDDSFAEGDDRRLMDMLSDGGQGSPDVEAMQNSNREVIHNVISHLSEREQVILQLYFGLDGNQPKTLDAIGKRLNITRERVRQIRDQSLLKLRQLGRKSAMRELVVDWQSREDVMVQ